MACKKSELIEGINSFVAAQTTSDKKLQEFSVAYLSQLIDTLEFAAEEESAESEETAE